MNEMVKFWLESLYEKEIKTITKMISNEHVFELGYDGISPNPHTQNIENLQEYIEVLEELRKEI